MTFCRWPNCQARALRNVVCVYYPHSKLILLIAFGGSLKVSIRFILLLAGIWSVAQAAPLTYTYTPISVPGSTGTGANGLNNAGQIVGGYRDNTGTHGFLYSQGAYTTIDVPGATATNLFGINNNGQVVGTYRDSSNTLQLFTESNGVFSTIPVPNGLALYGGSQYFGLGINDAGQIVGTVNRGTPLTPSAFLYNQGQFTLYPLGDLLVSSYAAGINNAGQIALTRGNGPGGSDAVVYSQGTFTTLLVVGSGDIIARGINNAGAVVGTFTTFNNIGAFLYENGTTTVFEYPSSNPIPGIITTDLLQIYGINDAGQLIGSGANGAVLATPTTTPEPGSVLLVGSGLSAVVLFTRKRWKKA